MLVCGKFEIMLLEASKGNRKAVLLKTVSYCPHIFLKIDSIKVDIHIIQPSKIKTSSFAWQGKSVKHFEIAFLLRINF